MHLIGEVKYDSGAEPTLTSIIVAPIYLAEPMLRMNQSKNRNAQTAKPRSIHIGNIGHYYLSLHGIID